MNPGTLIAHKRGIEASIASLTKQVFTETNNRKAKVAWEALQAQQAKLARVRAALERQRAKTLPVETA